MSRIASILLPLPLSEAFDYSEPEGMDLHVGDQVAAPLGSRLVHGVVAALRDADGGNRPLKPVDARIDAPPLPPNALEFIQWAARYAVSDPGQPLAMALRGARAPKAKPAKVIEITGLTPAKLTAARAQVLAVAPQGFASSADLARAAGVSPGVIKGLIEEGVLALRLIEADPRFPEPDLAQAGPELNVSQAAAATELKTMMAAGGFNVALLDGITGSGKTEVYLEAVHAALAADPDAQVLVLLPEIALTQAVIARFEARFAAAPGDWHSDIAPPQRRPWR